MGGVFFQICNRPTMKKRSGCSVPLYGNERKMSGLLHAPAVFIHRKRERDWYHRTFWMIQIYCDTTPRQWMNRRQRCDLIFRARNDQDIGHRRKKPKARKSKGTGKVQFTLEQTTKAHRGSRGIALFFL